MFPITLGGTSANSLIYQIAYHAGTDQLVIGGYTNDLVYKGTGNTAGGYSPILVMYKHQSQIWGKSIREANYYFLSCEISTDGQLVIAMTE